MPQIKAKPRRNNAVRPTESADILNLAEAAAYLRTTPEEVLRLVTDQGLPGRRLGKDCRFLRAAIQDWLRGYPSTAGIQTFWQTHFGALKDDPYLDEMLKEIYRRRGRPEVEE